MAAPIQTVNCEQKTPSETPDQPISSGSTGLKNGTGMEEVNSEEVPGNMLINNKVKSPNQGREVTMENFQDGGPQHQLNMSAEQSSGYSSMDGPRINSEMNNYSQNTGDQGLANEEYGKMNDTMNSGQMQGYGGGYNNRGNYIGEQHGGSQMPGNADMQPNSQQNNPYNQYNQQTVRPGYPQTSKSMSMGPPRPPSSGSSMNVMPGYNASPGPQRFLPGHSISQQGGPTPTLNQLLQSPNAVHRYQNSYSEYNMGQPLQKVPGELSSSQQYPGPQSWGAPRGMNSYPPQLGSPGYRSQGVPLDPSQQTAMKRPPQSPYMGPGPNYPPHQQSPQGQYGPQYSQRYPGPQGPQSRPPSLSLGAQSFSQQQLGPQYSQQVPPSPQQMSGYEQRPPQGYIQQQASQNFQGTRSQQPANSTKEGSDLPTDGHDEDDGCFSQANAPKTFMNKKELSGSIDELPSEGNQALTNSGSASSQVAHPAVSALRPTPSPSGSGSRSMSPAISNQQNIPMPPRPSSSQSDSGQSRMSQSPMAAQTGYNQPMAPPHMGPPIYGNKMHPGMIGGSQQMGPYSPQSQQFPQGSYSRNQSSMGMQGYGSQPQNSYPGNQPNSMGQPYAGMGLSRMGNHMPSQGYGSQYGHSMNNQYGGQGYPLSSGNGNNLSNSLPGQSQPMSQGLSSHLNNNMMPPNQMMSKGPAPSGAQVAAQAAVVAAASSAGSRSPIYLKHHIQQKIFGSQINYNSPPGPGPGVPGPPIPSSRDSPGMPISQSMPPPATPSAPSTPTPTSTPTPSHTPQPQTPGQPPPSSTPSSTSTPPTITSGMSLSQNSENSCEGSSEQRSTPVPNSSAGAALSAGGQTLVAPLTGPTGEAVPIQDEASQQSTASNTSNTEERAETPRPRKDIPQSHPPTPASTLPSPGAASMSSFHDEFESVSSPSWPRTPASPVINSQVHEYHPPSKRPDGLNKLYDLSDDPERRAFLDRLVQFNEERGSAITQCPTISKQPLDLFRLYLVVKDRGGFVEVTKAKHWKDVAGQIGIGASSSAAYTLRKQYVRHLLPFECKFDRGGIDPQPIISQLEAASRKKTSSKTVTAPSPAGSSNSQDSFPASNSQSMDGFPTPPGPYSQYPQGSTPNSEYSNQLLGPPGTMQGEGAHPSMLPNHSNDSINVQNPFADDMQSHQYPRPGMNSNMPPPGLQNSYGYGGASGMQQRSQSMPSSTMPPPYNNSQAISGPAPGPGPGPGPTPGAYPYGDQMNRGTPIGSQQEYSGDQYRRSQMINHEGYTGRPSEPYVPPAGAYPPNRIQTTPAQYGYGPQFDRERFEQQQGGMMPPNQQMRPSSQPGIIQQHSSDTYPPHRYGTQPLAAREPAPSGYPPRSYSGPPPTPAGPAPQPTYVGPNDQYRQEQTYSMPSQTQTADTSQAHLTSDSPKKSQQIYPAGQQGIYSPSNKMMPPQGYPQGPKRHPDFMKPGDQQYGSGPAYSQPGQPGQTTQPQPPYAGWRSDAQFGTYGSQGPATAPGQSPIGPQREDWPSRDQGGQWSPVHQRYPPQGPGHFNQGSTIPPHLPASLTPQNPMGPNASLRHLMMRVPPTFKDNKQSPYPMQPSKMQPPQMVNAQYPPKREIIFPPDSVEAVPPLLVKRKRMMSRDVTPVEAWRLMMALKSGLLCESTWALDVLSVLLFDDNTVLYFSLQHLPGLLEVLMEHYRRCLSEIFCISEELEIGFNGPKQQEVVTNGDRKWYEINGEIEKEDDEMDLGVIKDVDPKDRIAMVDCENYTFRSRHGKMVKVANKNDLFVSDLDKPWDIFEGFSSSSEHWQLGGGDTTIHIQTHFENDRSLVKLVRIMETVCNHNESDSDVKSECEKCSSEHDEKFACNGKKEYCRTSSNKNSDVEMILDKPIKTEPSDSGGSAVEEGTDENKKTEETDLNSPLKVEVKEENSCNENEIKPETVPTAKPSGPSYIPKIPTRKRPMEDYEDEAYNRDEPSLFLITDAQDSLLRRCLCISNILRSLSFVPGNDSEMSKHPGFLLVMGKLLLLHHNHALRRQSQRNYDKEEDADFSDSCSSLHDHEWWWEGLHFLRENTLVTLANIAGQLDLSLYPEEISLPILDGLLHWSVCPAAYAQDPLPTLPAHSVLSPQRLSLEALCKLSVQDNNVDLILATPPFSRIEKLFGFLARALSKHEDPVVREFSVVLLHYFAQAESGAARVIACQNPSVSLLIAFVEQAEQSALNIASTHGVSMLRDNPDMMGTSLDMLRRAANTLLALSRVPENRPLFLQHQQRLLNLVMSQILDQHVAAILSDVLYECSQPEEVLS